LWNLTSPNVVVKVKNSNIESSRMNREIHRHPISVVSTIFQFGIAASVDVPHNTQIVTQCRVYFDHPSSPAVHHASGTSMTPKLASKIRIAV
jgi:hypothetical protein